MITDIDSKCSRIIDKMNSAKSCGNEAAFYKVQNELKTALQKAGEGSAAYTVYGVRMNETF